MCDSGEVQAGLVVGGVKFVICRAQTAAEKAQGGRDAGTDIAVAVGVGVVMALLVIVPLACCAVCAVRRCTRKRSSAVRDSVEDTTDMDSDRV